MAFLNLKNSYVQSDLLLAWRSETVFVLSAAMEIILCLTMMDFKVEEGVNALQRFSI